MRGRQREQEINGRRGYARRRRERVRARQTARVRTPYLRIPRRELPSLPQEATPFRKTFRESLAPVFKRFGRRSNR